MALERQKIVYSTFEQAIVIGPIFSVVQAGDVFPSGFAVVLERPVAVVAVISFPH